jgi:DNA-nicking Smr family endonuclease
MKKNRGAGGRKGETPTASRSLLFLPPLFLSEEDRALWHETNRANATTIDKKTARHQAKRKPGTSLSAGEDRGEKKSLSKTGKTWTKLEPVPRKTVPVALPAPRRLSMPDRDTLSRLASGQRRIDARLDLHGLTQGEAHAALLAFIQKAKAGGRTTLLIITGKGKNGEGVLKRNLARWLEAQPVPVLGLAPAAERHGGTGAFYVLLRKAG